MISCYDRESDEELECIRLQFLLNALRVDTHKIWLNQAEKSIFKCYEFTRIPKSHNGNKFSRNGKQFSLILRKFSLTGKNIPAMVKYFPAMVNSFSSL